MVAQLRTEQLMLLFAVNGGMYDDALGCDNALYLDGSVSSLYAKALMSAADA